MKTEKPKPKLEIISGNVSPGIEPTFSKYYVKKERSVLDVAREALKDKLKRRKK